MIPLGLALVHVFERMPMNTGIHLGKCLWHTYTVIRDFGRWKEVSEATWRSARHAFSTFFFFCKSETAVECCPLSIAWPLASESAALSTGRKWQQDYAQSFIGGRESFRDLPGRPATPYLLSSTCSLMQLYTAAHCYLGWLGGKQLGKGASIFAVFERSTLVLGWDFQWCWCFKGPLYSIR